MLQLFVEHVLLKHEHIMVAQVRKLNLVRKHISCIGDTDTHI